MIRSIHWFLSISLPKTKSDIITHFRVAFVERTAVSTPDSTPEFYFELDMTNDKVNGTFEIIIKQIAFEVIEGQPFKVVGHI